MTKKRVDKKTLAKFVTMVNRGKSREEIMEMFGLTESVFNSLFHSYYEGAEATQQGKTPLRIFAELVGRKNELIRDLERLKENIERGNFRSSQAYVMAVKAQSDMLDSLVKIGQDLGLIIKSPEQVLLVGGQDVRDLNADQLIDELRRDMGELMELTSKSSRRPKTGGQVYAFKSLQAQREGEC